MVGRLRGASGWAAFRLPDERPFGLAARSRPTGDALARRLRARPEQFLLLRGERQKLFSNRRRWDAGRRWDQGDGIEAARQRAATKRQCRAEAGRRSNRSGRSAAPSCGFGHHGPDVARRRTGRLRAAHRGGRACAVGFGGGRPQWGAADWSGRRGTGGGVRSVGAPSDPTGPTAVAAAAGLFRRSGLGRNSALRTAGHCVGRSVGTARAASSLGRRDENTADGRVLVPATTEKRRAGPSGRRAAGHAV